MLPLEGLTQAMVERYWARDRAELVKCAKKHKEVVTYYDNLFSRINREKGSMNVAR